MSERHKGRKAPLSVQYVVRDKEQVDKLKRRFDTFLKMADILDRGSQPSATIPVILSQHSDGSLSVNLDPSCEVVIRDVCRLYFNIGEILIMSDSGDNVRVRIGVMGPEDA